MFQSDLKWWAGLVAACGTALLGLNILPHGYHDTVLGLTAVAGAICAYMITPSGSTKG